MMADDKQVQVHLDGTPVDPDRALAQVLRPWILLHHIGGNKQIAIVAQVWLDAKGL
jgi:hypothetical protein